ncbi:MAG TPA: DegT/DnrJ/EryC1/StrS family aminotransferase [Rhodopseudomonas sp.]|uniref:DegT/DnrJ/EryC1/StrS family aminotransferase n=1 Tax=Rhodopseudomonas sp. TaxID=1078 RepID=UPI002ED8BD70
MTPQVPLNDLKRHTEPVQTEILQAVSEVVGSGWFVLGRQVSAFEAEFAAYVGAAACIGVGNGTDALELALRAVGCGAGSEVVTVANAGMYASAAAVAIGATPVFADVDPVTLTMDPRSLEACIGERTKAIVATHLYGQMAAIELIADIGQRRGIPVVEDCAQAHGAKRGERQAGSFAAAACFSFYPTKNLGAMGDGGAIVTSDPALGATLRSLRQYGWGRKYEAVAPHGRNSRLDEIQAAILRKKLPYLDGWNARRRDIVRRYHAVAAPQIVLPDAADPAYVAHLCVARTPHRAALRAWMDSQGVATELHYPVSDHQQPALQGLSRAPVSLAVTERVAAEIVTLPCFPEMTETEIVRVCDALHVFRAADL